MHAFGYSTLRPTQKETNSHASIQMWLQIRNTHKHH